MWGFKRESTSPAMTVQPGNTIGVATVLCNQDGTTTIIPAPGIGLRTQVLRPGETYELFLTATPTPGPA